MIGTLCSVRCQAEMLGLCIFTHFVALQGVLLAMTFNLTRCVACCRATTVVFFRDKDLAHSSCLRQHQPNLTLVHAIMERLSCRGSDRGTPVCTRQVEVANIHLCNFV
jgi:hypothetical protein